MNVKKKLNNELLTQNFVVEEDSEAYFARYELVAQAYAGIENSIAVLSDMKANRSHIYYGGMGETLGMARRGELHRIDSIWEEEIFSRIHPDDLSKKHIHELRFFHFLKGIREEERGNYYLAELLRMRNDRGEYYSVLHRMFYVVTRPAGNVCLALCLYNLTSGFVRNNVIVNSVTGSEIDLDAQDCADLLSSREKEVLAMVGQGKSSKEIAAALSVSIHTVNRHRQNILQKLHVTNSAQAFGIARQLGILS